jgi:hypothetical protein
MIHSILRDGILDGVSVIPIGVGVCRMDMAILIPIGHHITHTGTGHIMVMDTATIMDIGMAIILMDITIITQ